MKLNDLTEIRLKQDSLPIFADIKKLLKGIRHLKRYSKQDQARGKFAAWHHRDGGECRRQEGSYAGRGQDKERISLLGRLITPSFPPQVRPLLTMHRRYWHLPCFPYSFHPLSVSPLSLFPLAIAFTLLPLSLSVPPASVPRSHPCTNISKERPVARVHEQIFATVCVHASPCVYIHIQGVPQFNSQTLSLFSMYDPII